MIMIRGTRRAAGTVRHVTPVPIAVAEGLVATVYEQVERDFGMLAPPVALHSPAPEPLAGSWMILRETLVARGVVDRGTKEAVATAVSIGNACPYCVDVHSSTMHGLARGRESAQIASGNLDELADPVLRAVAGWARDSGHVAAAVPVPAAAVPEVLGVAVVFHYINRMVNLFLPESPFPPRLPGAARTTVRRVFGRLMDLSGSGPEPGAAPTLLPAAPATAVPGWAADSPSIGDAFARAGAAFDRAGLRSVPGPVRSLVTDRLDAWDGRPPGANRGWLSEAVSALAPADQPAGRLALLAAFGSYQSIEADFAAVRATGAGDQELIEVTSWAAMRAALRVGTLGVGPSASAA
ncbi:carboxymuconolactone decarboxylase family protein [Micromonospora sp. NPDC005710]|uniref:carboxymuconolactone decarboxylase family protein n=1 Tax=Micromonospora sp. NPDC005710 TaxID=3157051 RepID=UPI0034019FB2